MESPNTKNRCLRNKQLNQIFASFYILYTIQQVFTAPEALTTLGFDSHKSVNSAPLEISILPPTLGASLTQANLSVTERMEQSLLLSFMLHIPLEEEQTHSPIGCQRRVNTVTRDELTVPRRMIRSTSYRSTASKESSITFASIRSVGKRSRTLCGAGGFMHVCIQHSTRRVSITLAPCSHGTSSVRLSWDS